MTRPRQRHTRAGAAGVTAIALTALLLTPAGEALSPLGGPETAHAAIGPNPYTDLVVTKLWDGTGHGTPAQTFVTTRNGFAPGDDTPTDGVVSSHDTAGYRVEVRIQPGPARDIAVRLTTTDALQAPNLTGLCIDLPGVTSRTSGDSCIFSIARGATATISQDVTATAADTAGAAVPGQHLTATVALNGQATYATVNGEDLTVVSAPTGDFRITPTYYPRSSQRTFTDAPNLTGGFDVSVDALRRPGFDPRKGVSTLGDYRIPVDVSAFPAGTTWTWNGAPVDVAGGRVTITGNADGRLSFTLPEGTLPGGMEYGDTQHWDIHLLVPDTALATAAYRNNGDGTQPGSGQPETVSTASATLGAVRGFPYPNNDFSAWTVTRIPPPPKGDVYGKVLRMPRTSTQTVWEPGNLRFDEASSTGYSYAGTTVAEGTELRSELSVYTNNLDSWPDGGVTVADVWDAAKQHATGPVTVTAPDGSPVPADGYRVEWSATAANAVTAANGETQGWIASDIPIPNASGVRVWFTKPLPVDADGGKYLITVPSRVAAGIPQSSPAVRDSMSGTRAAGTVTGGVEVVWPVTPTLHLVNEVEPAPSVDKGKTVSYQLHPYIEDPVQTLAGFHPQVTVTVDRCVTAPVNTSTRAWEMTVTAAVPGPTGRVCGDPDSTPAKLVFTPTTNPARLSTGIGREFIDGAWVDDAAEFPQITWRGTVTFTATGTVDAPAMFTLTDPADTAPAGAVVPVTDGAPTDVARITVSAATATAAPGKVEVGDDVHANLQLVSALDGDGATVIVLPRTGDGAAYADEIPNRGAYDGATTSTIHGTLTLSSAQLVTEDTSPGSTVWYTTAATPSLDATVGTWWPVTQAGRGGNPPLAEATALKVITKQAPGGGTSNLAITMRPAGNVEGDVAVFWPGATVDTAGTSAGAAAPWPVQVNTVASEVSGTVWWDANRDTTIGGADDEPRIGEVTVGLYRVIDGAPAEAPLATRATDADGGYEFTNLYHGTYTVRIVERGPGLPETTTTRYRQQLPVEHTTSPLRQIPPLASDVSTPISVGVDATITGLDFGFFRPDPGIDVTKEPGVADCDGAVCEVTWNLHVTNTGNTDLSGVEFTDTTATELYDVESKYGKYVPGVKFTQISAGEHYTVAVAEDGSLWGWGYDNVLTSGEILTIPKQLNTPPGVKFTQVVVDYSALLALASDGTAYFMGACNYRCGIAGLFNSYDLVFSLTPVTMPDGVVFTQISIGTFDAAAIGSDGNVYTWGQNISGELNNGGAYDGGRLIPGRALTPEGVTFSQVNVGRTTIAAVTTDGAIHMWGENIGHLGVETFPVGVTFTQVQIAPNNSHALALANDGTVWAWGLNDYGQLGDGTWNSRKDPELVHLPPGEHVTQIAVNYSSSYASTGTKVWSWGSNDTAQLGSSIPIGNDSPFPSLVALDSRLGPITQITANKDGTSESFAMALMDNGTIYGWGANSAGELGNGSDSTQTNLTPVDTTSVGGSFEDGDSAIPPVTTTESGTTTQRTYKIDTIPAGKTVDVAVTGRVTQTSTAHDVLNQAWVTSPQTPITGLLPPGQATPAPPVDPNPGGVVPRPQWVPGNATCSANGKDATLSDPLPQADSCDQVAVPIPIASATPGSISGHVFVDANQDGTQASSDLLVEGVPVQLLNANDTVMGETRTDARGFYKFSTVPPGSGYRVVFRATQTTPTETILTTLGLPTNKGFSYGYTTPATARGATVSVADPATGVTVPVAVTAGQETGNVNAGVVLANTALGVVKTSDDTAATNTGIPLARVPGFAHLAQTTGDDGEIIADVTRVEVAADGSAPAIPMRVTVTNTGSEPVTGLTVTDVTSEGAPITDLTGPAGVTVTGTDTGWVFPDGYALAPGKSVTLTGTLPAGALTLTGRAHEDMVTVTGTGTVTGTVVSGSDPWRAELAGNPAWTFTKTASTSADPDTGGTVQAGCTAPQTTDCTITWTLTATNTGQVTLDGLRVFDDGAKAFGDGLATLTTPLPAGVQQSGTTLVWNVPTLEPGQVATITLTGVVATSAPAPRQIVNTAYGAGSTPPDGCTADDPCTVTTDVPPTYPQAVLPILGGSGTAPYWVLGGVAAAAALALGVWQQRRGRGHTALVGGGEGIH